MHLIPKPVEIEEFEGFTPEKDIFRRKYFGEKLHEFILQTDGELVIALDSGWGEGKTTFVKMWRGFLKQNEIQTIYFDAYENDFLADPFLTLVQNIDVLLGKKELQNIREKFKKASVALAKITAKIGVKALTAGALDSTILKELNLDSELATSVDSYISERISAAEADKKTIGNFKEVLQEASRTLSGKGKIVFIVDELDRCHPDFALGLLEKIKHIFSVEGVVFLLVINSTQLEEVIRSRYGREIDAQQYLQKFIHIWAKLPKKVEGNQTSDPVRYTDNCLDRMEFPINNQPNIDSSNNLKEFIHYFAPSFRDIEKILTNFAILYNLNGSRIPRGSTVVAEFLCIIRVLFPIIYSSLLLNEISFEQFKEATKLEQYCAKYRVDDQEECGWLELHLFCALASHDEKEQRTNMMKKIRNMGIRDDSIKQIGQLLNSFTK